MTIDTFSLPVDSPEDVALVEHWLCHLADAREIAGHRAVLCQSDVGQTATFRIAAPSPGARALIHIALARPGRVHLLGRLWCMPGCVAGLAQALGRTMQDVADELRTLAALGVVYHHRGVWYARPFQRGGKA